MVTGSRLKSDPNATAPLPITSVDAAQLRALGNSDPTATLRQIPAPLASGTVADSIERGAGGIGQATLSLCQLGANRMLVVVDGYRHVSGVAGNQTVDVATVPNALIKRVDVLTGGASSIYGAYAVSGLVNYVLKKDFQSIKFGGQFGGEGAPERVNGQSLIPGSERIYANLRARYVMTSAAEVFVDAKYARNNSVSRFPYNSF